MADDKSQNTYEPLNLKWVLPIESTDGMITAFKNVIYLLGYVQKTGCNEDTIDKIIENDIRPITNGIRDEYDFFMAVTIIAICSMENDFSDTKKLMILFHEIIGKFIDMLEEVWKLIDSKENPLVNDKEEIQGLDISRLESGMVVKNYKEMCEILNEEIGDGNSKKAQLKEWSRYFVWEKKGQKFIILDIYDEPLPKDDGRQNKNLYVQYIEVILMKILSKQKNTKEPFYITTNQMWKLLGMINNNYKNISLDDLNNMITDYEVTSFDMKKFYQRCNQRLREILFSSLNKLEDRALIKYEIETVIVYLDEDSKTIYKPANDFQKKNILKAERKALLDMGLESKQHAYAKFKETEFFERVNAYLHEWYGWEYTFNRIKINYNKSDVLETVHRDELKLRNDFEEMKSNRLELNDRVVEALYKNAQVMAENRHKKANQEYQEALEKYKSECMMIGSIPDSFLPTKEDLHIFDYLPYFVELQNRLTDELICIRKPQERRMIIEFNDAESKELDELFKI
ncbi:MAG: hypothetical protein NC321_10480 [Clostridium sp.]|nr:hypothetical protein [Clostridium sp.]